MSGIGLQNRIQVTQRAAQIVGNRGKLLLEEVELRSGHIHQIARTARADRIPLLEVALRAAQDDLHRLAAHQAIAEDARLGVGRDAVSALDQQVDRHLIADRRVEFDGRHGADLHALHHHGRGLLHTVYLIVHSHILHIAGKEIQPAQEADTAPGQQDHGHAKNTDFSFSFHRCIVVSFLFTLSGLPSAHSPPPPQRPAGSSYAPHQAP